MKRASGSCRRMFGLDATTAAALMMVAACASSLAGSACSTSQDGLAFDDMSGVDAAAVGGTGSGLVPGAGGAQAVQGGSDGMGGVTVMGGAGGMAIAGASGGAAMPSGGTNAGGARSGGTAGMNTGGMNMAGMNTGGMNMAGMNTAGMNTAGMNTAGMNSTTYENAATPDRVACGNDTCEGSEVCCLSNDGPRCVATGVLCPTFITRACDDRSDCAGNTICCGSAHQDSLRSLCLRRDDCADVDDTMVICANSTQCQGEQRICCPHAFGQMTAGVCRSSCTR